MEEKQSLSVESSITESLRNEKFFFCFLSYFRSGDRLQQAANEVCQATGNSCIPAQANVGTVEGRS